MIQSEVVSDFSQNFHANLVPRALSFHLENEVRFGQDWADEDTRETVSTSVYSRRWGFPGISSNPEASILTP